MKEAPRDPGYASERKARYGLVFHALAGGEGGEYVVNDRHNGYLTGYRFTVYEGDRYSVERLEAIKQLLRQENARHEQKMGHTQS